MAISQIDQIEATAAHTSNGVEGIPQEAAVMVASAIRFCQSKSALRDPGQAVSALKEEVSQVHVYFRHALARELAEYLNGLDSGVKAIYSLSIGDLEEEGEETRCRMTDGIHLIVRVSRKTAALSAILNSLDRALLERYRELVAPKADRMASLLDFHMVDDRDEEGRTGFAVMLTSTFARPARIWPE